MKTVTINVGEDDIIDLQNIFKNEANFKPLTKEDKLIINILQQVLNNPKKEVITIESSINESHPDCSWH